ncbi:putative pyridoxal-dependent aspartate 1-decarboxylase [Mycetohabitans sp. B8]|uniref:pyridoxal-dependent aspartate 1-decarboxylase PanP n=1 Tax=Mycetohabitans sp. B8 TaxID=2841845 RepID=UPI001F01D70B|nr:putative pyridoxal-dependent aspartate 1-decarboxylase [Mycetohabitans sp. B8]MCG1042451.1 putative pyridoxal-dependent aspartate 1-decarboxylase [Mycetohabitans sp. B8]
MTHEPDDILQWFDADCGVFAWLEQMIAEHPAAFFASSQFKQNGMHANSETTFSGVEIPEIPASPDALATHLLDDVFSRVMPVASPTFVGHMTSSLPSFLPSLAKVLTALNQNVVKLETSAAMTALERQVIGMLHKLIFGRDDEFYPAYLHSGDHALGVFCSGGTVANLTALWASRNNLLRARDGFAGVSHTGLVQALRHYGYDGLAILVSERAHYSLSKAADVLGIGRHHLISIPVDKEDRICIDALRTAIRDLQCRNIRPMAIVGIAGTTETGAIDPLDELADVAQEANCHFHVDAAWGGASLMSERYRHRFAGIERADSVVIDAHKQLYVPMGSGMVLFKEPTWTAEISQHASYIVRKGSNDLGRHTLEGSRGAASVMLYANLQLLGRKGYAYLIDRSIDNAQYFASLIERQPDFELVNTPQLCILTYRYVPEVVRCALNDGPASLQCEIHDALDALTVNIQEMQRAAGRSFVSRTRLTSQRWHRRSIAVFRVVFANPMTTRAVLDDILAEQRALAKASPCLPKLLMLASGQHV